MSSSQPLTSSHQSRDHVLSVAPMSLHVVRSAKARSLHSRHHVPSLPRIIPCDTAPNVQRHCCPKRGLHIYMLANTLKSIKQFALLDVEIRKTRYPPIDIARSIAHSRYDYHASPNLEINLDFLNLNLRWCTRQGTKNNEYKMSPWFLLGLVAVWSVCLISGASCGKVNHQVGPPTN